jgi:hypothetical protein
MLPLIRFTFKHAAVIAIAMSIAPLAACDDAGTSASRAVAPHTSALSVAPGVHRQYGVPTKVGNGRARAYVTLDADGETPLEFGVALDSLAMHGLPAPAGGGHDGHGDMHETLLPLPPQAPAPYKFVELDWNPAGHGAPYQIPHFDFHFYTIDVAERNAIDPSDPQYAAKAANFPAPAYLRPNYACPCTLFNLPPVAVAVPRMGMHWLDVTSPELSGATFTTTMITGSWDGKVIFQEPMITRDFIMATSDTTIAFPLPKRASPAGWYPASYRVSYDEKAREYRIALSDFAWLK